MPNVEDHLINIRKLVALDIALHVPRFIMVEFGLGTPGHNCSWAIANVSQFNFLFGALHIFNWNKLLAAFSLRNSSSENS